MHPQKRASEPSDQRNVATSSPRNLWRQVDELRRFVDAQAMRKKYEPGWFEEVEGKLHRMVAEFERGLAAEIMRGHDVDAAEIEVEGQVHRRVLRAAQTYTTLAGDVVVERWLYRDKDDDSVECISPLERRLGIVGGFWTASAAKTALWVVAQMVPQKAAELFDRVGGMAPSKSSLDRLPKQLSERWERNREPYETALRDALVVPEGTTSVAVSIDGVLAPIDGGKPVAALRSRAEATGLVSKGPAGFREVGCATVSFCNAKGDLLGAIRMARTPECKKLTLKASLAAEVFALLSKRPDLPIVKIADGVDDNWSFLTKELPPGEEVLDFFHATEHLSLALGAAYGPSTREARHHFEELRDSLRDDEDGAARVTRALEHLQAAFPRRVEIRRCVAYFHKHRHRMNYADLHQRGLPIGSGVVEAACKTLVAQRLKLSGMRWGAGAQAILTARGWDQSERFDEAWALLAAEYQTEVHVLARVLPFAPPKKARTKRVPRKRGAG